MGAAAIAAGSAMLGRTTAFNPVLAGAPHQCMDDSRYPHSWTHGDPTTGIPTSPVGNNGYYYLNVIACSTTIEGKIWTANGTWRIDIDDGYNHANPLIEQTATTPFSITYTAAHVGQFFRVRFANESGFVRPDHASAYSADSCALVGGWNETNLVSMATPCSAEDASGGSAPPAPPTGAPAPTGTPKPTSKPTPTPATTPPPTPAPTPNPTATPDPSSPPPQPPTSPPAGGSDCPSGELHTGSVSGSSESFYITAQSATLCAQLTWSGSARLNLVIYTDQSGTSVLAQNDQGTSGEVLRVPVTAGRSYKIKAKPVSGAAGFSLVVSS